MEERVKGQKPQRSKPPFRVLQALGPLMQVQINCVSVNGKNFQFCKKYILVKDLDFEISSLEISPCWHICDHITPYKLQYL